MDHHFDVELAVEVGVEKAILLHHIMFWLAKNTANESHLHEGRTWTYCTAKAFGVLMPYLNRRSITRWLSELVDEGYLLATAEYNRTPYDRTTWFAAGPKLREYSSGQNGQSVRRFGESARQNGPPIPDNSRDNSKDTKSPLPPFSEESVRENTGEAPAQAVRLADLLLELIRDRKPDFIRKGNWAKDIDLMLRIDNREPEDVEAVIRWCQADCIPSGSGGFCWANNILSGAKLREKYDRLDLARKTKEQPPATPDAFNFDRVTHPATEEEEKELCERMGWTYP